MAISGTIRVTTEELRSTGETIRSGTEAIGRELDEMQSIVQASGSYWEGEGGDICRSAFTDFQESIQEMISRLEEHVTDLYQMAGIYEDTEKQNQSAAEVLSGDVII